MTKELLRLISHERTEKLMLVMAGLATFIYVGQLVGVWARLNLETVYFWVGLSIDVVFVFDLLLKVSIRRTEYLRSPWFLIDFISTLPILEALIALPVGNEGFRFIRIFRLLRAIRSLRALRMLLPLNVQAKANSQHTFKSSTAINRKINVAILSYTLLLSGLTVAIYSGVAPDSPQLMINARINEFYLVLGTLMGMLITAVIMRFYIYEITSYQFKTLLNMALPSQVSNYLLKRPDQHQKTVSMPATVIFCDLKGFTRTVERLSGDLTNLKMHLEDAMEVVTEAHKKHDLIIDKYIGDAVMSFRGGDLFKGTAEDHALRVVKATLDGMRALQKLGNPYFNEMKIGGASAKNALIGSFGSRNRLSYTILGDRVNLAARLESSVSQCHTSNLFCDLTHKLTHGCDDLLWRRFGRLKVVGKEEDVVVHEVFYADEHSDTTWIESFHQALEYFERKEVDHALEKFQQADYLRAGGDAASKQYIKLCRTLLRNGFTDNWTPVFKTY